jgi:uncharacterized protein YndB with AHSA1/START domain
LTRELEFPRVIVWDALVDEDLVSGWLAEAQIEPELGGRFDLTWLHRPGSAATTGEITELVRFDRLDVLTSDSGVWSFGLEEFEGGSRGTSTRLSLTIRIDVEPAFSARVRADWLVNLDQLEELLRGHPVDWTHWDRDHHAAWARHFRNTAG